MYPKVKIKFSDSDKYECLYHDSTSEFYSRYVALENMLKDIISDNYNHREILDRFDENRSRSVVEVSEDFTDTLKPVGKRVVKRYA